MAFYSRYSFPVNGGRGSRKTGVDVPRNKERLEQSVRCVSEQSFLFLALTMKNVRRDKGK